MKLQFHYPKRYSNTNYGNDRMRMRMSQFDMFVSAETGLRLGAASFESATENGSPMVEMAVPP